MNPYQVLVRPIISEKAEKARDARGIYTFVVAKKATKTDIKNAIEKFYEVKVEGINTHIRRGKPKRRGAHSAQQPSQKRALVSLKEGFKISIFDAN